MGSRAVLRPRPRLPPPRRPRHRAALETTPSTWASPRDHARSASEGHRAPGRSRSLLLATQHGPAAPLAARVCKNFSRGKISIRKNHKSPKPCRHAKPHHNPLRHTPSSITPGVKVVFFRRKNLHLDPLRFARSFRPRGRKSTYQTGAKR